MARQRKRSADSHTTALFRPMVMLGAYDSFERRCPMTEKLRRRDLVKTVAAAGGLLVLGSVASAAEPDKTSKLPGEWLFEGKEDQPCAIFQHGRVLLLVNEEGELATGRVSGANTLTVLKGSWEEGLTGTLSDDGKSISWGNGTTWKRP